MGRRPRPCSEVGVGEPPALLGPHSGLQDEGACTSAAVGFMGSAN